MKSEEETKREIFRISFDASQLRREIENNTKLIEARKKLLQRMIKEHNTKLHQLLKERLHRYTLTWCTVCHSFVSENNTRLVVFEGEEERTYIGEGSYNVELLYFCDAHRVCSTCRLQAFHKHESTGIRRAGRQSSFSVFFAKKVGSSYYIRKSDRWVRKDNVSFSEQIPSPRIDSIARMWGFPEKLFL